MKRLGSSLWKGFLLIVVGSAVAGCATAPIQEMSDARQAIHSAKVAGGERYTPEMLEEAERLITQASHDLSAGNYTRARDAALSAKHRAILAREASLAVQGPN